MINNIKNYQNTNFYYFYKIITNNYLKLFIFLIIGLFVGYFLHQNADKQLIIKKKISPINVTKNIFQSVVNTNDFFVDFIRISKEKVAEKTYYQIFDPNYDSSLFEKSSKLYDNKIPSNISYKEYLKLSEGFYYLKERIDYEFNIYQVSKKIKFKHKDDELKERTNKLKDDYDKYLLITNQIIRFNVFKTLLENPAFYKKALINFNSDLILVNDKYLMDKLYEKNSIEIEKITKVLRLLICNMNDNCKEKLTSPPQKKKYLEKDSKFLNEGNKIEIKEGNKIDIKEIEKRKKMAGQELDRIFKNYFKYIVNGIDREFEIEIVEKSLYFYLLISSLISIGLVIFFISLRDVIKILKQN